MINRRQFVYAAAAGVVTFARGSELLAADYDLIVRGGRVIDPSLRVNAIRDVAITGDRIAAIEADIAADAAEVIDATGKVVVPGLLDVHTHYARDEDGPLVGLAGGVTGWVDAGSGGADHIDDMVAIAKSAPQPGRVLINIGRAGILPEGDTMDLRLADVDAATEAIARNRDVVVGVKARLTRGVADDDIEVLRRAPPWRVVRRRQRTDGASAVGHLRWHHSGGFLARYDLHRREHDEPDRRKRHRFPQRSVQVPELRDDVGSGRSLRDRQCFAHLPTIP